MHPEVRPCKKRPSSTVARGSITRNLARARGGKKSPGAMSRRSRKGERLCRGIDRLPDRYCNEGSLERGKEEG